MLKSVQFQVGAVAVLMSGVLLLYGIPTWVSVPTNVSRIVLSPAFWPYAISGVLMACGLALVSLARSELAQPVEVGDVPPGGALRLAAMAVVMVAYVAALPLLGMVWASMAAFAVSAFVMHTRHPLAALICAVCIPLLLYGFFAHVASVAVPQGLFVRLP